MDMKLATYLEAHESTYADVCKFTVYTDPKVVPHGVRITAVILPRDSDM